MPAKVLVADDDFDNRNIVLTALTSQGYHVCEAKNGEEALEVAGCERPDLILMDLSMPKLSGWDATRRIKADPLLWHIPVLAFSAHALTGDDLKAKEAGCADYISKPCTPRQVLEKVAQHLRGANHG